MKNKLRLFYQKKPLLVLFVVWSFVQAFLINKYGIVTTNEAIKYKREAFNWILHKNFSEQKYIFYSAYIFIHVLFIKLGIEMVGVYLFQLLVNLVASFFFYKTAVTIYKNNSVAFIAALLLILCFSWQYWTVCLYSESFFCSLVIIFTYCLFGISKTNKLKYLYAVLVFCILLCARPAGIFFIPVIAWLFVFRLIEVKRLPSAVLIMLCISAFFLWLLYYEMNSSADFNFIKPFVQQNVICDVPYKAISKQTNYDDTVSGVLLYIKQNPFDFLKLCTLRFIAFWSLTRSFYSEAHNWMLRLFFYPLYFFALIKLRRQIKFNCYFIVYCLSVLIVFTISVMLTCDEWSNRFIMPVLPIIILLAAYGLFKLLPKRNKTIL